LASWGWRSIFYFITLFTFVLWMACLRWLPESLAVSNRHPFLFGTIISRYMEVGSNGRFMLGVTGIAFSFSGVLLYVVSAPAYVMDILHLTVKDFGWLFVTFISGMTLGSMVSGHFSHRFKPAVFIKIGYLIMILAAVASLIYAGFFTVRIPWAIIPHFFYGFGMALGTPAMTVLTLEIFPHVKGLPSSMQNFIFLVIFAIMSGFIAPFLFASAFRLAVGTAIGLVLSLLLWWLSSRGEREHDILSDEEQQLVEEVPHL